MSSDSPMRRGHAPRASGAQDSPSARGSTSAGAGAAPARVAGGSASSNRGLSVISRTTSNSASQAASQTSSERRASASSNHASRMTALRRASKGGAPAPTVSAPRPAANLPPAPAAAPTSTAVLSASDAASSSTSDSSSGSDHYPSHSYDAAPTPFNTYCDSYVYYDDGVEVTHPTTTQYSDEGEYAYAPSESRPSVSRPYGESRRPSQFDDVPTSSRPVPAPPQIRTYDTGNVLSAVQSSGTTPSTNTPDAKDPSKGGIKGAFRRRLSRGVVDHDTHRLQQLGYDAVLGRDYNFWSSFFISWLNIGSLQGSLFAVPGAYKYGGPMMMLVAWPVSAVLSLALVLPLSELASAYPVAGAMASWSWKCARGGVGGERYWGWVMGGIVLGGHIGNLVLVCWQNVTIITGVMNISYGFHVEMWHRVLFYLAIVTVVGTVGGTRWGTSSRWWIGAGIYGLCVWMALCISLLATGVAHRDFKNSPPISTKFTTVTGWNNHAYVYILGWQMCTIAAGSDASAHMSEETQNPSRNVPVAMTLSVIMTYLLGYIAIVILLLAVNPSDAEFLSREEFATGHILARAHNTAYAVGILVLCIFVLCLQLQAQLQSSSRFLFALARDRALPFSDQIKRTNKDRQPWVAHLICVALWAPWAFLQFSTDGLVASIVTVTAASLSMLGYLIPVALYLLSSKNLQLEGRASWSMRKWSRPIAVVGALFCAAVVIVQVFPNRTPVTAQNISWSPAVIAMTLVISVITWKLYGDKHYSGPIRALTKWETGVELDLDSTLQASTQRAADPAGTSLKLAVTPCFDESRHTVTVATARTAETVSGGEWTAAPFSTFSTTDDELDQVSAQSTQSAMSRPSLSPSLSLAQSRSRGTMGAVAEDKEGEAAAAGLHLRHPRDPDQRSDPEGEERRLGSFDESRGVGTVSSGSVFVGAPDVSDSEDYDSERHGR